MTYAKAIVAAVSAVATWGVTAGSDGSFTTVEWFGLLGAVVTAVGVFATPNSTTSTTPTPNADTRN